MSRLCACIEGHSHKSCTAGPLQCACALCVVAPDAAAAAAWTMRIDGEWQRRIRLLRASFLAEIFFDEKQCWNHGNAVLHKIHVFILIPKVQMAVAVPTRTPCFRLPRKLFSFFLFLFSRAPSGPSAMHCVHKLVRCAVFVSVRASIRMASCVASSD